MYGGSSSDGHERESDDDRYNQGSHGNTPLPYLMPLALADGITKVLFDEENERIIGCGIVGPSAGDLVAEAALAIEMGADAADIGLTIHPHPTLSETIGMAAETFEGTITDLYIPKKK
jgi:dihydrolipoamide dehydrogenase